MTGSLEALLDDALLEKVQGALSTILFDPSVAAEQKGRAEHLQARLPVLQALLQAHSVKKAQAQQSLDDISASKGKLVAGSESLTSALAQRDRLRKKQESLLQELQQVINAVKSFFSCLIWST